MGVVGISAAYNFLGHTRDSGGHRVGGLNPPVRGVDGQRFPKRCSLPILRLCRARPSDVVRGTCVDHPRRRCDGGIRMKSLGVLFPVLDPLEKAPVARAESRN